MTDSPKPTPQKATCPFCAITNRRLSSLVGPGTPPATVEVMLTDTKTIMVCEEHGKNIRKPGEKAWPYSEPKTMNTTDQPTPEPGWRMLDVGEVNVIRAILIDVLHSIGETNIAEDCRLVDAADYLRDKVKERIHYLTLAHQQGAENTVFARKELARVRADLQRAEKDRDENHKAWCEAKEQASHYGGMLDEMQNWESIRNGDLVEALEQFVNSCRPHPTEHPSLFTAWIRARAAIKGMPHDQGEQRCQAVASNGEGEAPTSAPATPATPLSGNRAGEGGDMERMVEELEAAHPQDLPSMKGPQPLP